MENPTRVPNPPTRIPSKASGFAASLWAQSVGERIQLLINPSEEAAATFFRAGLESFDVEDLRVYIQDDRDVIPILREWMMLDNEGVRPWAQTVIRIWWPQIFATAMDPAKMLADLSASDPAKGVVLNTPKGRVWFNSTVYLLLTFFRGYAKIAGDGIIQPPPSMPDRLRRKALAAGSRVLLKVQGKEPPGPT